MDDIITYDNVKGKLTNPPSLEPRPNYQNIQELVNFLIKGLKHIQCPQSGIFGWAGVVMDPTVYLLGERNPFQIPVTPASLAFPGHRQMARAEQDVIKAQHNVRLMNYKSLYNNVYSATYDA